MESPSTTRCGLQLTSYCQNLLQVIFLPVLFVQISVVGFSSETGPCFVQRIIHEFNKLNYVNVLLYVPWYNL